MTVSQLLQKQYRFADMALRLNVKGISNDESIIQPEPAGSCINWIAGHLLATREDIFEILSIEPMQSDEDTEPYRRNSDSSNTDRFTEFLELLTRFKKSQKLILSRLESLNDEQFAQPMPNDNPDADSAILSGRLLFYHFHEAYHIGQIGVVRRLIGKDGAI